MAAVKKIADLSGIPKFLRRARTEKDPLWEEPPEAPADLTPVDVPGVRYARAYFAGIMFTHKGSSVRYDVDHSNAPCNGETGVLVIEPDERVKKKHIGSGKRIASKKLTLFCPFDLSANQVEADCGELGQNKWEPLTRDRVQKLVWVIQSEWRARCRMASPGNPNFAVAALVLLKLGAEVPTERPAVKVDAETGEAKRSGKDPAESLLKSVRDGGKRGDVCRYFLAEPKDMLGAMAELGMSRPQILTHLFGLWKDHGVGYSITSDQVTILLPDGCEDPFAETVVDPLAEEEGDAPKPVKAAQSGKPMLEERTALPEKGKRREVALAFKGSKLIGIDKVAGAVGCSVQSVKSHLYDLHTKHGLGFEVSADKKQARLLYPKGFL